MTEEEAISICKNIIRAINGETCYMNYSKEQDKEAIETLLELYHKQRQELDSMQKNYEAKIDKMEYEMGYEYISKDEVLKALGYEENDEEYKRLYNKEELILSLIRTINEECDRLEDIEDQKVEVAVDFIEEKRDKYWKDKIREKIEDFRKVRDYLISNSAFNPTDEYDIGRNDYCIRMLEDLIKE